jgi:hypothetical protein
MERTQRVWAQTVAASGAGLLLISLWLHWYSLHIPGAMLDRAEQLSGQLGILGPYVNQAAELLRHTGAIHGNAWQAFAQIDVILAILAAVTGIVALLMLTGRATGTGAAVACGGVAAIALTAYRIASPPGPDGLLHPQIGAYAALAAGAAIVVGGLLAEGVRRPAPTVVSWTAPAPAAVTAPGSIPPPGP